MIDIKIDNYGISLHVPTTPSMVISIGNGLYIYKIIAELTISITTQTVADLGVTVGKVYYLRIP